MRPGLGKGSPNSNIDACVMLYINITRQYALIARTSTTVELIEESDDLEYLEEKLFDHDHEKDSSHWVLVTKDAKGRVIDYAMDWTYDPGPKVDQLKQRRIRLFTDFLKRRFR